LRLPILYGEVESLAESAVTSLGLLLFQNEGILVDHWATRYPTYVDDVAVNVRRWADKLIENQQTHGIYHFSADEPFTKYEMISVMGQLTGRDYSHVTADSKPPDGAIRPKDAHLDDARLATEVELRKTPFKDVIGNILKPYV
jgi:dTDP-4-dehydrorhamnose reductase